LKRLALLCALAIALPSCSGSSTALPQNTSFSVPSKNAPRALAAPARGRGKKVKVRIRVRIPKPHRRMKRGLFHRLSIAAATQGIQTRVSGPGGSQTSAADISATSANCNPSGTGRTCTFDVAAPPGSDTFVFQTYDKKPVGGAIPGTANQLGAGVASQTIVEGTANAAIPVTLGGVVASVGLIVTPQSMHTLIQATATLEVFATDADGNAIVGSYVDANGNPISISFSISPNYGCCPPISASPASLSAPSTTGVLLSYNGQAQNSGATETITASTPGLPNATATLNVVDPVFTHVYDPNLNAQGPFFGGIAFESPDDVVYTFNTGTGGVGDYTVSTATLNDYPAAGTDPVSGGLAFDGSNVYVAGPNNLYTYSGGTFAPASGCTSPSCTGGSGSGIAVASSGNIFYGNGTTLQNYVGSTPTPYSVGGTPSFGMAVDQQSPKNVWIANGSAGHNMLVFNTSTFVATPFALPASNARPFDVIADAQGMIWVTDRSANEIDEIDPSGPTVANRYYLPYGSPWYVVQDPIQQTTYWYSFQNGYNAGIGRLDTVTGTMSQVNDYCCNAQPGAILEQNGLIYMPLDGASYLDVVQP
jgi:hypothetical protein